MEHSTSGKTAVLDRLAVAIASWLLGIRGYDHRYIQSGDVRLEEIKTHDEIQFLPKYPVEVAATGIVLGESIEWSRAVRGPGGKTTTGNASKIRRLAEGVAAQTVFESPLPLICYYGTGRLWVEPKQFSKVRSPVNLTNKRELNPFAAYRNSVDPRFSTRQLIDWIARQSWIAYQEGREQSVVSVVQRAIVSCIEGARHLYFDPKVGEVVVEINGHGRHPFSQLSDGQRCMLALVGDIAQRAVRLNAHLGDRALRDTPGVVLIDELEMHLHPRWQRTVASGLKSAFPSIQFFCTTHSPQIIGQVPREEVFRLDKGLVGHPLATKGLDSNEILEAVQGANKRDEGDERLEEEFLAALDEFAIDAAERILTELSKRMDSPNQSLARWQTLLDSTKSLIGEPDKEAS